MSNTAIRQEARQALKGLHGKYSLFLLPILLTFLSSGLSAHHNYQFFQLNSVISYQYPPSFSLPQSSAFPQLVSLMLGLFTLAAAYTMLEVLRQQRRAVSYHDLSRIFTGRYLLHLLLLVVVRGLLLLPWLILLFIGAFLTGISLALWENGNAVSLALLGFGGLVSLFGLVMFIIKTYSYKQAELILYDRIEEGDNLDPFDIIKTSKNLMAGHKLSYFFLQVSFIGWYLLTFFSLGLVAIYLIPYKLTTDVTFYHHLTKNQTSTT